MSDFRLDKIAEMFERCFQDSGVFERDNPGQNMIERDILTKAGKKWIVVCGGIDERDAFEVLPSSSKRAERASTPVTIVGGGEISFLFVVRPAPIPLEEHSPLTCYSHFAPGDDIPLIEWHSGYLRVRTLPDNEARLTTLRWELDTVPSQREPMEDWLI